MWWREGEHWSSLTWARRRIHFVVVRGGSLCPRALTVRGGSLSWVGIVVVCWWGVIRVRLRDALVVALVTHRGGHSRGWGVIAAHGRLSFMGPWLGHRCGRQGVAVRGGVVVCGRVVVHVRLWEVLVVALVACGRH